MINPSRGHSSTRAPGASPSGDGGIESAARSRFSPFLQAIAEGLHHEAAAYAAGLKDGEEGAASRPLSDWSPEKLRAIVSSGDQSAINHLFSYFAGRARGAFFNGGHHGHPL